MNILALDTSTEYCSVALLLGTQLLAREVLAGQRHSELVLPMVAQVLAEAGVSLKKLDGIAFGAGPGSFTGLRIACGVTQGLAFGAGLPVVPVGSLLALAQSVAAARVVTCLDARMGEIYHAAYLRDGDRWQEVSAPSVCRAVEAPLLAGGDWNGCGGGFAVYGEALAQRYQGQIRQVEPAGFPHARDVATLARPVLQAGAGVAPEQALPVYVRDKVALKMHERT